MTTNTGPSGPNSLTDQFSKTWPAGKDPGVKLVTIQPYQWKNFNWPDYQRKPNPGKVKQIAKGIREGYNPGPITIYEEDGRLNIVDGGHRVKAYIHNLDLYDFERPILALLYDRNTIDQNLMFVRENTKLRMNPINIIRADSRSQCCRLIRGLKDPGSIFERYEDLYDYPIKPLTIVKASLILAQDDDDLAINSLAYLSVARATRALDGILEQRPAHWDTTVQFLDYDLQLWGMEGRHTLNFGVLGFAYFLAKNREVFFKDEKLVIKSTVSQIERKCRRQNKPEYKRDRKDYSDFTKLAALRSRWENWGDQLWINASRDPVRIAIEINNHFWSHRKKSIRIWRPELTL